MRVLQENPEGIGFPRCTPKVRYSFTIQPSSDALGASPLIGQVLEADGWNVTYIGPKSLTRDIVKHLQTFRTDLVAISVATPLNLGKTKQLIDAIKGLSPQRQPRIIVGGAAMMNSEWNPLERLGADAVATDISEGVAIANRLMNARTKTA